MHREWWSASGKPLSALRDWVEACAHAAGFPATLVAVADGKAVGSVFLHTSEAPDRPAFTPYLGALYVEPEWRSRGVGSALIEALLAHASRQGYGEIFLNANAERTPFYLKRGWRVVEANYRPARLNIMRHPLPPTALFPPSTGKWSQSH